MYRDLSTLTEVQQAIYKAHTDFLVRERSLPILKKINEKKARLRDLHDSYNEVLAKDPADNNGFLVHCSANMDMLREDIAALQKELDYLSGKTDFVF